MFSLKSTETLVLEPSGPESRVAVKPSKSRSFSYLVAARHVSMVFSYLVAARHVSTVFRWFSAPLPDHIKPPLPDLRPPSTLARIQTALKKTRKTRNPKKIEADFSKTGKDRDVKRSHLL